MTPPRVLLYVQHLLGIGHLQRVSVLARAMSKTGLDVHVVSGGDEASFIEFSGISLYQLPIIKVEDASFGQLVDGDGTPVDAGYKESRKERLLEIFKQIKPAVLITELYPFGRRQFRFELIPLLEAARASSTCHRIVSSMRDIMVEMNQPHREQEMIENALKYFDDILLHGDPDIAPLEKTFSRHAEIDHLIRYTGYVVDDRTKAPPAGDQGTGEVIVSTGSGAVGEIILETALNTRAQSVLSDIPWRFLTGPRYSDENFMVLRAQAEDGVIIERSREDFKTLLQNCRLSISQGGYNTSMEILAAKTNAIIIPFTRGQSEQSVRAGLLAERGLIQQIPEDNLTIDNLAEAISTGETRSRKAEEQVDLDGAAATARLVKEWAVGG